MTEIGGRNPAIWGHRGASLARPENTLESFAEAARQGAAGVELDVRRARDGSLVVHHDAALADRRPIADLSTSDLPDGVELLDAALRTCFDNGLFVNIEIKNFAADTDHDPSEYLAGAVVELVDAMSAASRVIVSSFSLDTINRVHELASHIPTGYLTSPRVDQRECLALAVDNGHTAIHPHHVTVGEELTTEAHGAGLRVNTWTVDDPDRIRWLASIGVDAIITNDPRTALAALN